MSPLAPVASAAAVRPRLVRAAATAAPRFRVAWIAVAILTLAGFGLRLAAASGDLWLDELWSLDLVSHITSPDQVFWNIPHDNNHPLNSLWMFVVGQHASPLIYRLPAVVFGTATILVASRIAARVNPAAAVAAAAMMAFSYAATDYGSEARGYGGLILAILLATDLGMRAVDRLLAPGLAVDVQGRRTLTTASRVAAQRLQWPLAAAILFGTCSHLTMLVEAAVLAAATALRLKGAGLDFRAALDETVALFKPSLLLLLPLLAAMGAGMALHHGFTVGGFQPFTVARYLRGYGGLLQMVLGIPTFVPNCIGLLLAGVIIAAALQTGLLGRRWLALALVALVVWPAFMFVARVPNTEYARYFLTAGLLLPVFLAEITGRLWERGGAARAAAVVAIVAICAGQVPYLRELIAVHRGAPAAAVALMAGEAPATFAARNPAITDPVVDVYASRLGAELTPEAAADRCRDPARWFVYDTDYGEKAPERPELAGPGCTARYVEAAAFPSALWSGRTWTLYHRQP